MHRSNFRTRKSLSLKQEPKAQAAGSPKELDAIREQIENVSKRLSPLTASVERLAAPKEDISVPKDIAQALRLAHSRLDRLESQQEQMLGEVRRMATAFSNAILKLSDKVEKICGGEDSSFSLAHSLEKLIETLENRKFRIKRDKDGNMTELEAQ